MKHPSLIRSFSHAFNGIATFFRKDRNGRIHLAIAVWTSAAGVYFELSKMEWICILLCIAMVIGMEMLNHALEDVCDTIHTTHHPLIKSAKDVSAAAVLWASIISAIIGLIIFVPRILVMLK